MKIDLEFAELHTPLFLGGRNFGLKLDKKKFAGIQLTYDRMYKELIVVNNGKTSIVPIPNVVSMTPQESPLPETKAQAIEMPAPCVPAVKFRKNSNAQVSTPTSHVFKGEGEGQ